MGNKICFKCNESKPLVLDVYKKGKWQAWVDLGDMKESDAMLNYIKMYVNRIDYYQFSFSNIYETFINISYYILIRVEEIGVKLPELNDIEKIDESNFMGISVYKRYLEKKQMCYMYYVQ